MHPAHRRLIYALLAIIASAATAYAIPIIILPGVMDSDPNRPALPAFQPGEMWNIDSKMDDGLPGTGELVVYGTDAGTLIPSCTDGADNSAASAATAKYLMSADTKECAAVFRNQF